MPACIYCHFILCLKQLGLALVVPLSASLIMLLDVLQCRSQHDDGVPFPDDQHPLCPERSYPTRTGWELPFSNTACRWRDCGYSGGCRVPGGGAQRGERCRGPAQPRHAVAHHSERCTPLHPSLRELLAAPEALHGPSLAALQEAWSPEGT